MNWYIKVLQNYVNFSGRARRKEYWMFALFNFIFLFCASMIDNLSDLTFDYEDYGLITVIYSLFVFLPSLAVGVRRLHDVGKSGIMILIGLIPIIGTIWLLVLFISDSEPTTNEYGSNPKE